MPGPDHVKHLFRQYDIESLSYTYGNLSDLLNAPKHLKTTGSSATVTELNATDDVFAGYGIGDVLYVNVDGTWTVRTVTGVGSIPDQVTVDTAVDWSNSGNGRAFSFRRFTSGTATTSGWFPVADFAEKSVEIAVETLGATSIDFSIEGRINGLPAATLWTQNFTATGAAIVAIGEHFTELRVGVKGNTLAGANSVSAHFFGRASTR